MSFINLDIWKAYFLMYINPESNVVAKKTRVKGKINSVADSRPSKLPKYLAMLFFKRLSGFISTAR